MFKIKYSYKTGDSFHSEDKEKILEFDWIDLQLAKQALQRIREHYLWYESINNSYSFRPKNIERPEWHIKELDESGLDEHSIPNMLVLQMDEGKQVQFWCPWCGYFEHLYGAEIVLNEIIRI